HRLVDAPFEGGDRAPEFFQTLRPVEPQLASRLISLVGRLDVDGYDGGFVDEDLVFLLRYLLRTHRSDSRLVEKVDAVRPATRMELFKRLCVVRDVLESTFSEPLDLGRLSREACLSVPQLIRHFGAVFHLTP